MNEIAEITIGLTQMAAMEKYISMLNEAPPASESKQYQGRDYIEIRILEKLLDEHYYGLWQTDNFRWQIIANEIVGSIDLKVFHPVAKIWITRTGAGAAQIRSLSKENGGDGDITNVKNKIKNALEADFPHLKSDCLRNAIKSLGAIFGRVLAIKNDSRFTSDFHPLSEKATEYEKKEYLKQGIERLCSYFDTDSELNEKTKIAYKQGAKQIKTIERLHKALSKYESEVSNEF